MIAKVKVFRFNHLLTIGLKYKFIEVVHLDNVNHFTFRHFKHGLHVGLVCILCEKQKNTNWLKG